MDAYEDVERASTTLARESLSKLSTSKKEAGLLGCGFRDGGLVPRTCSISLPIRTGEECTVYWTIVMMSSVVSVKKAISAYLAAAQAVVKRIEKLVPKVTDTSAARQH